MMMMLMSPLSDFSSQWAAAGGAGMQRTAQQCNTLDHNAFALYCIHTTLHCNAKNCTAMQHTALQCTFIAAAQHTESECIFIVQSAMEQCPAMKHTALQCIYTIVNNACVLNNIYNTCSAMQKFNIKTH